MKNTEKLRKWSTLVFLGGLAITMLIACVWTARYWGGASMMAAGLREQHGYVGGIFAVLGDGAIPFLIRLKLALFVAAPLLCALLAMASGALAFLAYRDKEVWRYTGFLASAVLFGTWAGMRALREIEDPIFFDKSPWVSTFKTTAYPAAILAALYLVVLLITFAQRRKSKLAASPLRS